MTKRAAILVVLVWWHPMSPPHCSVYDGGPLPPGRCVFIPKGSEITPDGGIKLPKPKRPE